MATVRRVITLDKDEADVIHKALHSDGVRAVLDEVRAALSAPLTLPAAEGQKRPSSLTTRVRAGQEITEETRAQIAAAVDTRRQLLVKLSELVALTATDAGEGEADTAGEEIRTMIEAHDEASKKLDEIKDQIADFTGGRRQGDQ